MTQTISHMHGYNSEPLVAALRYDATARLFLLGAEDSDRRFFPTATVPARAGAKAVRTAYRAIGGWLHSAAASKRVAALCREAVRP